MKKCNKCLEVKSLSEFSNDSFKKDGKRTICRECSSVSKKNKYNFETSHKRKNYLYENIDGFEKYHIKTNGEVINKRTGNVVKHHIRNGYYYVGLYDKDGNIFKKNIHRLLALAYILKQDGKEYVNHIDGNKLNNDISNLEWCTASENTIHAYKNNLTIPCSGEKHHLYGKSILKEISVVCTTENGEEYVFKSSVEAVRKGFATQDSKVRECCNGNRKTHNKNKWRYL